MQNANMRMIQRGDRTRFPIEARVELPAGNLDRHFAAQACIHRTKYLTHATLADGSLNLVWSELCSGGQNRESGIIEQIGCGWSSICSRAVSCASSASTSRLSPGSASAKASGPRSLAAWYKASICRKRSEVMVPERY